MRRSLAALLKRVELDPESGKVRVQYRVDRLRPLNFKARV